jgi:hypothetical protein
MIRTIAMFVAVLLFGETAADTFTIHSVPTAPSTIKRWIAYQMLGPIDHPHPIVYITTRHFDTTVGELLITLSRPMYERIAKYTQARIDDPDCPGDASLRKASYSIEITQHEGVETHACVLPQALACEYLSGIGKLSGVDLKGGNLKPMANFIMDLRCANEIQSESRSQRPETKPD